MSTNLALCIKTARKCKLGSNPTAVTAQSEELQDIITAVDDAHVEIQNKHQSWRWLRSKFTVNTNANTPDYAGTDCTDTRLSATVDRFSHWIFSESDNPPLIYLSADGVATQQRLVLVDWDCFRTIYAIGTQTAGRPVHVTIDPQNSMVLGPKPDAVYVVSGEYQMSAQRMTADGDIPEMPAQFHDLIMYRAMEEYGYGDAAAEVIELAKIRDRRLMNQLERNQLPPIALAGPLA